MSHVKRRRNRPRRSLRRILAESPELFEEQTLGESFRDKLLRLFRNYVSRLKQKEFFPYETEEYIRKQLVDLRIIPESEKYHSNATETIMTIEDYLGRKIPTKTIKGARNSYIAADFTPLSEEAQ